MSETMCKSADIESSMPLDGRRR